ncbi:Periplasmic protein TonB links inner and outer membranes-like protein [Plesiocystis pacifica SIR-1]|uniref:Periplasmic protein TonB links inner and outer membranes-like protein n=1 Tax=Plesiocystis pacifica SIR-1 TaxID=391625 RepID=A6G357_9BACT|nr:fibro-slime domain-containing protein [Plesiocystis pacifica]EDM79682.1 Periplasmic protein TonB links inner and outer membranes-like protein [Plesiocystis pacifica SIR-1]
MRKGITMGFIAALACTSACGDSSDPGAEDEATDTAGTSSDDEVGSEQGTGEAGTTGTTTGDGDTTTTGDGDTTTTGDGDTTTTGDGDTTTTGDGDTTTTGDGDTTTTGDGDTDTTGDGDTDTTGGQECGTTLYATVRDFQIAHPDFQYTTGVDLGIVEVDLGADQKPVYAGNPNTPTTTGVDNFNQWYNDVDGVNQPFEVPIELLEIMPGVYEYANGAFFPIDDEGWGNEGNPHNYHFTLELHTNFLYTGGEVFTFEGDDDLWVFVNGKLGIDLGGVHGPLEGSIDMDALAGQLGIEIGGLYDLDFFFAERHTTQSNFKITTTINCFNPQ